MTASRVQLTQGSAPATPGAGLSQVYVNTAKQIVIEDDDGNTLTAPLLGPTSTEVIAVKSDLDAGDVTTLASANAHSDTNDALKLAKASNLSDLASVSTARTNLGLGTAAVKAADTDTTLAANSDANVATQKATKAYADAVAALQIHVSQLDTDTTLAANSDTRVASQKATKAYVDQIISAQDAMVFKGVQDCSGNPNYPAADRGWTYRVSVAGKIGGASGIVVEVGDIFICLDDSTASGNQATVGTHWGVIQTNIDGAVTGPASSTDGNIVLFNGATGKVIKDAGIAPSSVGSALITAVSAVAAVDTLFTPDVDIASAATVNLGASTSYFVNITGTVTVTSFGTAAAGVWRLVRFAAACPITYDATTMRLQGGASVTTAANDYALCISRGSGNWRVIFFPASLGINQMITDRMVTVYTSNGSWSPQPWTKHVQIIGYGGGGGGGAGRRGAAGSARSGGLGGYGAASTNAVLAISQITSPVAITVGAAGTGAAAQTVDSTNGAAGGDGGDSSFGSYLIVRGGWGGAGGTNAATAAVGSHTGSADGRVSSLASSVLVALSATVGTAVVGAAPGGTGGSITTGNAELLGQLGGLGGFQDPGVGAAGAAGTVGAGGPGGTGGNGNSNSAAFLAAIQIGVGAGGGGGGPSASAAGGPGGNGSGFGGGGGGGGASLNGFNSGAGGNGSPGAVYVIEYAFH